MATVLIWENNFVPNVVRKAAATISRGAIDEGHEHWGHAAMHISDDWKAPGVADPDYVSWVPAGFGSPGVSPGSKARAVIDPQACRYGKQHTVLSLFGDLELERYFPDHVIRVTGLDEARMKAEWAKNCSAGKHIRAIRKNCSTMVARILRAGGLTGLDTHSLFWTPRKIRSLVLCARSGGSIQSTTWTWAQLIAEMIQKAGVQQAVIEGYSSNRGRRVANRGTSQATAIHPTVNFPWIKP
jgi:hypothetical protein